MSHVRGSPHEAFPDIEHSVLVQSQTVGLVRAIDQSLDRLADVLEQLLKDLPRLLQAVRVQQLGSNVAHTNSRFY